jgi:ABC-type polysaccharide/polyol phosphate export permease
VRNWPLYENLVRREVRQRYKGSFIGLLWSLVTPAVIVATYSVVFHFLFRIDVQHYWLFLFTGLTVWTFFMGGAQTAASSIVGQGNLVKKLRFPRELVPLSAMTGNAFIAGAMLAIALPLTLIVQGGSLAPLVTLPLSIALLAAFTAGFGLALSALNVYFRDVEHILAAVSLPWFFLSPIFYRFEDLGSLNDSHNWVIEVLHWANPFAPFLLAIRDAMFFHVWPEIGDLVYMVVAAVIMLAFGIRAFRRLEGEMANEL